VTLPIIIRGIGVVGGFGSGINALKHALETGKISPKPVIIDSVNGSIEIGGFPADLSPLTEFIPLRALRRIDHYTQMALLGSYLALKDADMIGNRPCPMGIIVATGYGSTCNRFDFADPLSANNDICYSPTKFSNSVHNAAAAHISVFLKEYGPNLSINHFDMSIPSAFLTAFQWLEENRLDAVMVGGVDEYSKVMGCYGHFMKYPLLTGEGSSFFLLTRSEDAAPGYACIQGISMGSLKNGTIHFPQNAVAILNTDGYGTWDQCYEKYVPGNMHVASYVDYYGNLPVGMGFDIAIAAIGLKEKRLYASSGNIFNYFSPSKIISTERHLNSEPICCFKVSTTDEFGMVTLSPPP